MPAPLCVYVVYYTVKTPAVNHYIPIFRILYLTPLLHAKLCDRGRSAELFNEVVVVGRVEIVNEILQR